MKAEIYREVNDNMYSRRNDADQEGTEKERERERDARRGKRNRAFASEIKRWELILRKVLDYILLAGTSQCSQLLKYNYRVARFYLYIEITCYVCGYYLRRSIDRSRSKGRES